MQGRCGEVWLLKAPFPPIEALGVEVEMLFVRFLANNYLGTVCTSGLSKVNVFIDTHIGPIIGSRCQNS